MSDIPSQVSPKRASLSRSMLKSPGVVSASPASHVTHIERPFAVSTFNVRPENCVDTIWSTDVFSDASYIAPFNTIGIAASFTVPNDRVFIARSLRISVSYLFRVQPPYNVPLTSENYFLTNVNGYPNVPGDNPLDFTDNGGGAPLTQLSIYINNSVSLYNNIILPWAPYFDYTLPLYLVTAPTDTITIVIGQPINTIPTALYGGIPNTAEVLLSGNLLSNTIDDNTVEPLNTRPIMVSV